MGSYNNSVLTFSSADFPGPSHSHSQCVHLPSAMVEGSCRIPDTALPSYAIYPGLRLYADPSVRLGVRLNGTFGSVDGDDAHCRRVCDAVPGCNAVTRSSGKPCLLHDVCIRPPANAPLPEFPDVFAHALSVPNIVQAPHSAAAAPVADASQYN